MTFTIGILETGRLPEELSARLGTYGRMFESLIGGVDPSFQYRGYAVLDGELPESPHACDGWIITGSRHGVYENLPWMIDLQKFLRDVVAAEVPVVGICFGHQILASALGGRVEKSERGWGVGPTTYKLAQPKDWMGDAPAAFTINAMHQDQVVDLPPDAEVLASSDFCPYAALSYHDKAISFQAHPEFNHDVERSLITYRTGVIPEDRATPALQAIDANAKLDAARVGNWIVTFFKDNMGKAA